MQPRSCSFNGQPCFTSNEEVRCLGGPSQCQSGGSPPFSLNPNEVLRNSRIKTCSFKSWSETDTSILMFQTSFGLSKTPIAKRSAFRLERKAGPFRRRSGTDFQSGTARGGGKIESAQRCTCLQTWKKEENKVKHTGGYAWHCQPKVLQRDALLRKFWLMCVCFCLWRIMSTSKRKHENVYRPSLHLQHEKKMFQNVPCFDVQHCFLKTSSLSRPKMQTSRQVEMRSCKLFWLKAI